MNHASLGVRNTTRTEDYRKPSPIPARIQKFIAGLSTTFVFQATQHNHYSYDAFGSSYRTVAPLDAFQPTCRMGDHASQRAVHQLCATGACTAAYRLRHGWQPSVRTQESHRDRGGTQYGLRSSSEGVLHPFPPPFLLSPCVLRGELNRENRFSKSATNPA